MSTPVLWQVHPVSTIIMIKIQSSRSNPLLLRTPTITWKSPRKRKIVVDKLVLSQANKIVNIDSISE